jgi:hypothetical protein
MMLRRSPLSWPREDPGDAPLTSGVRKDRTASRRPVAQGSGQALRALARRAGGRLGIGVFRKVWRQQRKTPMKPILELHVSGLSEGETLTFRIEPVGPNVFLSPAECSSVSENIDRASNNRRRIGTRSGRRS